MILNDKHYVGFVGKTLLARHVSFVHYVGEENCYMHFGFLLALLISLPVFGKIPGEHSTCGIDNSEFEGIA